jgi:hypothetical protein
MQQHRPLILVAIPASVFIVVTVGLRPTVNLIARLKSPHFYRQYGMSGTWVVGLVAAAVTAAIEWVLTRRADRGPDR